MGETHYQVAAETPNYRRYECGVEMQNDHEHELPEECPVCGATAEEIIRVNPSDT